MSVRRNAARLAMVLALTAGTAVAAAIPVHAQEQEAKVELSLPSKFTAGEKAGGVTVKVTKRSDDCVSLRTALAIRLPGASVDQVAVQARIDDDWVRVPLADDGSGLLITDRTAPDKDELCKGKSRSVRYQLAFAAGTPAGTANIVAEAYTAGGELLGRTAGAKQVGGRQAGTYQPVVPTPEASEEPTPEPSEEPPAAEQSDAPAAAPSNPDLLATSGDGRSGSGLGIGAGVLTVGVGMVAIGVALLVLLIRRGRSGGPDSGGDGGAAGAAGATMLLPRVPR